MKTKIIPVDNHQTVDALENILVKTNYDRIFILVDDNTKDKCLPLLDSFVANRNPHIITIPHGDINKNLKSLTNVWRELEHHNCTRYSLLINLGGGMVTDLGGFAASTFKRGIDYINIPTTLLSMVDAAFGGKVGINLDGFKNEIGVFTDKAKYVLFDTNFLKTLDDVNLRSGYAEMLKHGIISDDKMLEELLDFDLGHPDFDLLSSMIIKSVQVKEQIVAKDPNEDGIRKALNFGHTFGHAFESLSIMNSENNKGVEPIPHGYAVAYGMLCELYLSNIVLGFPIEKLNRIAKYIQTNYGHAPLYILYVDFNKLIHIMKCDKKNKGDAISFTLLSDIGNVLIDQTVLDDEIATSMYAPNVLRVE